MHYVDIDTRPLPGSFVAFYVDWEFFIIALMEEIDIFTAVALFLIELHKLVKWFSLMLHIRNILFSFSHYDG